MNYYSRIAAQQENELRPHLEHLIRLLLWCSDELGGSIDPAKIERELKFNPLWEVDAQTDANIRKTVAETDNIYLTNGVLIADEVRETRFGQFGLTNITKFSGDEADLEKMTSEVYSDWKERGNHG